MLNEVQIEGIVAREPWTYDRDLFFRIASYRDADMSAIPDITPGRGEPEYVNARVPGAATSLMTPTRGDRVRSHGFAESRDCKESMADFMRKTRNNGGIEVEPQEARGIKIDRNTIEMVATRVVRLLDGRRSDERHCPDERTRRGRRFPFRVTAGNQTTE